MKQCIATLESMPNSPYSQSREHRIPRGNCSWDEHEEKTWQEKAHWTEDGHVFIPPMVFKNALVSAASYLKEIVKGKNRTTYERYFKSAIIVPEALVLPETKKTVKSIVISCWSEGKAGRGGKVLRKFPIISKWAGKVKFVILDDVISEEAFEKHLIAAGNFIGVGRWRPEKNGLNGRFNVKKLQWKKC